MTLTFAGLLIAAFVAMAFVERLIRSSPLAAAVVLLAALGGVVYPDLPTVWPVGPFSVHIMDVAAGAILVAAVARLLRIDRLSYGQLIVMGLGTLLVVSLLTGLAQHSVNDAVQEARSFIHVVAVTLYFATVEPRREVLDRIARFWLVGAALLLATAVFRWLVLPFGLSGGIFGPGGMRVLWAAEAFFLLQSFFIALVAWRRTGNVRWGHFSLGLLIALVLLQHRSVWVALLVGIGIVAVRDQEMTRRLALLAVFGVIVGAVFATTVFGEAGDVTEELAEAAQDDDTFQWRLAGWLSLLEGGGVDTPLQALIGKPFGSGWERQLGDRVVVVSPHNYYVETYLRLGVAGLMLLTILYLGTMRHLRHSVDRGSLLSPNALLVLLATHLIYYIPYSPGTLDALILGLAISVASGAVSKPLRAHLYARNVPLRLAAERERLAEHGEDGWVP